MATKNLVPRNSGEGGIGRVGKSWATGFFDALYLGETLVEELLSNKNDGYTIDQNLRTSDDVAFNSGDFSSGLTINGINVATGDHADISTLATNLTDTGVNLQGQIDSFAHAPITGWHTSGANHLLPAISGTQDIGAPNRRVRDLYLEPDSLYLGESNVSVDPSGNLLFTRGDGKILPLTSGNISTSEIVSGVLDIRLTDTGVNLQAQITTNVNDISTLSTNLTDTGVNLQAQITTNVNDISTLSTNLTDTGVNLQAQITTNVNDISTLSTNLTDTGVNLQAQITTNVNDISTLSTNLTDTGVNLQAQITTNVNDISTLTTNLTDTGVNLQAQITTNVNDISTLTTNLTDTGVNLQAQITSNDSDISTLTTNLTDTGVNLQAQITSNDSDISTLTTNLTDTGVNLQAQITSNDSDISTLTTNLTDTGVNLQAQITSNDSDISTLTTNLTDTGVNLQAQIDTKVDGGGTTNYAPKWSDADTLTDSIIYDDGNLGIGTSTPQHFVHITGDTYIGGDLIVTGTTTTIASVTLTVDDKNIELGSVDAPTDTTADGGGITLKGTTDKTILWENDTDSWDSSENFTTVNGKYIMTDKVRARDSDGLYIVDDADNGIFVEDGGMVGIGQLDPQALLHVGGKTIIEGDLDVSGSTLTVNGVNLQAQITTNASDISTNTSDISTLTTNLTDTGVNLQAQITSNDSDISTLTTNLTDTGVNLQAQITSNDSDISTLTTNLTNTGIHLHGHIDTKVDGGGTTNYVPKWSDADTLTDSIIYDDGDNVGIGTIDPTGLLHLIYTGDSAKDIFVVEDSAHFDETRFTIDHSGQVGIQTSGELTYDVTVGTGVSTSFVITTGGRIGIGTENPTGLLHVDGTAHIPYSLYHTGGGIHDHLLVVEDSSHPDASPFVITNSGDVGIGTNDPSAPLEISSTVGGVIMPRMTTTQMNAISPPTNGEMIYNTTVNKFYGYAGGSWNTLH